MADMTALAMIKSAYRKISIVNPNATKLANGLEDLQNMLSLWSVQGLFVPNNVTEILTLTQGQSVYTIGEDGTPDFNTVRPVKLLSGFIRIDDSDFKVRVNMSLQEYNDILQKGIESRPRNVYYDPQYPNANLKFDFEADGALAFHLTSEKILTNPTSTASLFSIPLEYNEPIIYNLAIRLTPDKNTKIHPSVALMADQGMSALEDYNALERLNSPVKLDSAIVSVPGRGGFTDFKAGGFR